MTTTQQGKYKIEFDEDRHEYRVNGVVQPGVSSIINKVLKNDAVIPEYAKPAMKKGVMVHKIIHLHNEKNLDVSSVDSGLVPYFESYLKWEQEVNYCSFKNEVAFYQPYDDNEDPAKPNGYCGTIDTIGSTGKDIKLLTLPDYKTGGIYDTYPWQITAYTYHAVRHEMLIAKCGCLQLFKDGKMAKFHEYNYRYYEQGWKNIFGVYRIKTGEYK